MTDKEKLIENGFESLTNGKWIVKGRDPNHTEWFTIKEAIQSLENSKIYNTVNRVNSDDPVSIEDAMTFLSQRYQLSTTVESKCIKLLIKHIKNN